MAAMALDFKRLSAEGNENQTTRMNTLMKKAMKARICCILLLSMSFACNDDEKFVEVPQKPGDIFHIDLCPTLLQNANALFPESQDNQAKYEQLFNDGSQQRIVLTQDAEIYVSFVAEGATIGNVLGYYIYNSSNTPGSPEEIQKELIFPNIDNSVLNSGDTRKLGSSEFKAGTVIGFFLIVGGYRNDGVYLKRPTSYTDHNWNRDQAKQHVLYQESECGSIIVGFEDKSTATADKDYNDIIFMVSDNRDNEATTSFDLQNVVALSK
jgi:hypothetical protein